MILFYLCNIEMGGQYNLFLKLSCNLNENFNIYVLRLHYSFFRLTIFCFNLMPIKHLITI